MAYIQSFHSAAHSLVQAAVAAGLKQDNGAPGIAAMKNRMRDVTTLLSSLPRRTPRDPRSMIRSNPLGSTSPVSPECLTMIYDYAVAVLHDDQTQMTIIKNEFEKSPCDSVGWASAAADYIASHAEFWKKLQYVNPPTPPDDSFAYVLPEQDDFKLGILGDWGTGEPVAQQVINAMMACGPDLIIHVGDVYYAGTSDEVQANYLDMIASARQATGCTAPIYNLPGNHDYYTKGKPFYDALSQVNDGASFPNSPSVAVPMQEASFFSLRNSWLQLQGMDTGYYDSDLLDVAHDTTMLNDDEAAWHLHQLNQANAEGRGVLLFSHHQGWSRFLGIGDGPGTAGAAEALGAEKMRSYNVNLQRQLAAVPKNTVIAWFWGHEHVLGVYDQAAIRASSADGKHLSDLFPWVEYGACIGFSAFPMLETDDPYKELPNDIHWNETYKLGMTTSESATVYNHGFTIVDLKKALDDGPTAVATYYWVPGDGNPPTPTPTPTAFSPPSQLPSITNRIVA